MLQNFIDYLEARARIGALYVWGGQGHRGLTDQQIRVMETSARNANRVIALKNRRISNGVHPETIEYHDCSGLGMYWLQNAQHIYPYDMTADGMMSKCRKISRSEIRRGDWVFRTYQESGPDHDAGDAYHIGYVTEIRDGVVYVVEAMGRDVGVVKRDLNASGIAYWTDYGRPDCFAHEIDGQAPVRPRELKLETPYLRGDDVRQLQQDLVRLGFLRGSVDGIYGPMTAAAHETLKKAQMEKVVDIIWSVKRVLKKASPTQTGDDVKALQSALTRKGFPCGKIDGELGPKTDAAIRAFQSSRGLTVDGKAGRQTITALGGTWVGR